MTRAILFALLLSASACGDLLGPAPVAGTYDLESVNGGSLPFRMVDNPDIAIVSRRVVLGDDGRFSDRYELRVEVEGGSVPLPVARAGSWAGGPGAITLTYASGRLMRAVADDGRLVLDDRGVRFTLTR